MMEKDIQDQNLNLNLQYFTVFFGRTALIFPSLIASPEITYVK